ncbi:HAD family hydrolase [Natribacillus halophilus]|uniref:Phosphoglycolate phosphatase n=1 Tax=Natribacillus halophilus TaxID=549003 RepID=A0A1G8QQH7_9BACI|nr:HAD family phosphatase [Natribacillus halophilus]SDJ06947.1 phosphoglycolate phosphatase [Natribacillus halophilus]
MQVNSHSYNIQGILFDKDGTLLYLHSLWSSWFDQLWEKIKNRITGNTLSKSQLAESIGLDTERNIVFSRGPLAIGTMDDMAIIVALHLYHQNLPWNEAVQIVRDSMEDVNSTIDWKWYLQPLQGLETFLEKAYINGVKMGVVTSDDTKIANQHLHLLNIFHYFHSVIGSDQIDRPKPFPDIGYKACQKMMINPQHVVVIGDTNGDMEMGKSICAQTKIGVIPHTGMDVSYLKDANHIIRDYRELSIT